MSRPGARIAIILPVQNERASLGHVLARLSASAPTGAEIVVVDDGSSDGSAAIALAQGVRVVVHARPMGYGRALKTGLSATSAEKVAILDGDGTYDPEDIVRLDEAMSPGGMVIGARLGEPCWMRGSLKGFFRIVVRLLTGLKVRDLNSGLRVFDRRLAESLASVLPDRFSFTTTLTLGSLALGAPVSFLPVRFGPRVGESKFRALDAWRFARTVLRGCGWIRKARIQGRRIERGRTGRAGVEITCARWIA